MSVAVEPVVQPQADTQQLAERSAAGRHVDADPDAFSIVLAQDVLGRVHDGNVIGLG